MCAALELNTHNSAEGSRNGVSAVNCTLSVSPNNSRRAQ